MFSLIKDDGTEQKVIGKYSSKEDALLARVDAVREWLYELKDNEEIDKYAVEDWMWGVKGSQDDEFYVDESYGCSFNIVED